MELVDLEEALPDLHSDLSRQPRKLVSDLSASDDLRQRSPDSPRRHGGTEKSRVFSTRSMLLFHGMAVVGLVDITPGAGFVGIPQSIIIGLVGAIVSNIAVSIKQKSKLDDTLDVFPCHGIGGMVGMLLTGVFASTAVHGIEGGPNGLFYGNPGFFFTQLKAMSVVVIYSFTVSYAIFKFINFVIPMRVSESEEEEGLDASQHDEKYLQGTLLVHNNGNVEEKSVEF